MGRLQQVKAMIFFTSGSQKNSTSRHPCNPMQKRLPFEPLKQHFTNGFSMSTCLSFNACGTHFAILLEFFPWLFNVGKLLLGTH
jgi:hypothetical protein